MDTNSLVGQVKKASGKVKKEIKEAFNPNDISDMKFNGKMFNIKNIQGYSKEVKKLTGDLQTLSNFKSNSFQVNTTKTPKINTPKGNAQSIEPNKNSLTSWEQLRVKVQETRNWISKNVSFSFVNQLRRDTRQTSAEEELLKNKINELKAVLDTVNNGKGPGFNTNEILKMEVEVERLQSKLDKIEEEKERKRFF